VIVFRDLPVISCVISGVFLVRCLTNASYHRGEHKSLGGRFCAYWDYAMITAQTRNTGIILCDKK
jgi:hypothetical protein